MIQITVKFDVGQEVWFMKDNKPCNRIVLSWRIDNGWNAPVYTYENIPNDIHTRHSICEADLFPTKQDLLNSL